MKVWLTAGEAADVANRSERTIRNWVRDGVLLPHAAGLFRREDVLRAEQRMRKRRGRPSVVVPVVVRLYGDVWAEVSACGSHREALAVGMVAISCVRCRIERVQRPGSEGAGT